MSGCPGAVHRDSCVYHRGLFVSFAVNGGYSKWGTCSQQCTPAGGTAGTVTRSELTSSDLDQLTVCFVAAACTNPSPREPRSRV